MKTLKKSFLFLLLCILSNLSEVYSQEKIVDSIDYYIDLKDNPIKPDDPIKAVKYFQRKILKLKDDDLLKTKLLILIAQIEKNAGSYVDSENTAIKALELLSKISNNDSIVSIQYASIYNHLGQIYRKYEDYNKALSFYENVLSKTDNNEHITILLNNRGYLHLNQGNYELAIKDFQKAYNNSFNSGKINKARQARILDNLGVAQSKIGNSKALTNLIKGLEIRREEGYRNGIISSYINLGEHYKNIKKYGIAKEYANKASKVADSTKSLIHKQAVLLLKNDLKNDPEYNELKRINDSINSFKKASSIKYVAYKYEKEEAEKGKQFFKFLMILAVVILIFLSVMSIFLFRLQKSKNKKKTLQVVYKTESHISKKVHDEVANDVFQVMNTLQNNANVNEKIIDDLDAIYIKTRNISKEHSVLDYEGNFKETLNDLLLSYNSDAVRVIIKDIDKVNWDAISKLKKETIYKVLQELMVNMKKHSQAEFVALTFKNINKKIAITYSDDGVGTSLKKNTGLQNMENRIQSINGTINFESGINKGFKSKITV